ncbi:MAG: nitronate monooxygenase [Gaiellaceae bacterium]|jgi:nitronate monooxygenase
MTWPIVGAPLAGGPSTPALAAAVCEGGGLGFVAAGYKAASDVAGDIAEVRRRTQRPFGVNVFVPVRLAVDEAAIERYVKRLEGEAERYAVACGEPRWSEDDWDAKLDLVARERPAVVSFAFGCPEAGVVAWLRGEGIAVWCTVTTAAEASIAAAAGVDALVVQGAEAGGHQSSFTDTDDAPSALVPLLQLVRSVTDAPLIAAGGIATGRGVAAALAAGASAAQIGSALMLAPEAGTSDAQRVAFSEDVPTALTRAFTGRRARGIVNRFMRDHDSAAPKAYPHVHYVTAPLRAAARAAGDSDGVNLWAGQAYRLARAAPAAELVERWGAEARAVLRG